MCVKNSPRNLGRSPVSQLSQIARIASTNSRIRAAGFDHGIEKRLVMCGSTCEPRPRLNRPPDRSCRSFASTAVLIGLRANATAIDVPNSIVDVVPAATPSATNGSCWASATQNPS